MKKIVAFLFAFIALTACSSEKVDESSIASNTDESISQIFEEKELTDSQLIHIKDSFQIDTNEISDSGFFFLYDSPINMQWINDSKAIIFTYKGNDFFEDYRCRIYIIDVKTKRLSFIKEVTFPKLPQISVYSTENFVFLFFHENNPIKLKINLETFETTEDIFSEGSHISQNGLFLLEAEGKIKIFRESDFSEPIYEFQIESYGDTSYEFASWSPNGNYVMFLANNSSGRATYVIYNVKGERITSFSVNKDRGKVCWCADGEGLVLCDYRNTEQKYYVFDIKTNTKEEVPCDQNTFFVDRYFSLTYEQNQWEILLQSKEKAQGTRIFLPFKSNNELQAIYNNQSGLCLILSPGKKVLLYCVNIES